MNNAITLSLLVAAMIVEGWRIAVLYHIASGDIFPAIIFSVIFQSSIFYLAYHSHIKASIALGVVSGLLSISSFVPNLIIQYDKNMTVQLEEPPALPKFEDKKAGQRLWNEADAYVKAFNDETEQVKKKIKEVDEKNAKLKVEYPTLRYSSPRFPFYVNVIVALIVSVFPSLLTTFISYRLSEQKKEKDIGMNQQQKFTQERKTETVMAVNHDRNDQLLADKNAGLSVSQLAKKYGVSENRVRAILKSKTNKGV